MGRVVVEETGSSHKHLVTFEEMERLIALAKQQSTEPTRPVNILVNLGNDERRLQFDNGHFRLRRSKLVWILVAVSAAAAGNYLRTHAACKDFRQDNRFYYGMTVDRCVGILLDKPLASMREQLSILDKSY